MNPTLVAWTDLLLPTLVAAVLVFIASSLIHMVLQLHKGDYRRLSNEDEVRAAIRKGSPTPGQYVFPHCMGGKDMANPEMQKKFAEGPIGVLYVRPNGMPKMGPFLGGWFVYTLIVGLLAGYIARTTVPAGAPYLEVFQVIGAASWLAYAWQSPSDSIWKGKPWSITVRALFDGLIYAAITAGSYAWLWPK